MPALILSYTKHSIHKALLLGITSLGLYKARFGMNDNDYVHALPVSWEGMLNFTAGHFTTYNTHTHP